MERLHAPGSATAGSTTSSATGDSGASHPSPLPSTPPRSCNSVLGLVPVPDKSAKCLVAVIFTLLGRGSRLTRPLLQLGSTALQMPLTTLPRQGSNEVYERDAAEQRRMYTPRWAKKVAQPAQQSGAPSNQNRRRTKNRFSRTGSYNGMEDSGAAGGACLADIIARMSTALDRCTLQGQPPAASSQSADLPSALHSLENGT